jgi:hypothetical protein
VRSIHLAILLFVLTAWSATATAHPAQTSSRPNPNVNVILSRTFALAPADVRAAISVPRNADNRTLLVTLDSGAYFRSSEVTLDGNRAPVQHPFAWRSLPAGSYVLRVEVIGASGVHHVMERSLFILN